MSPLETRKDESNFEENIEYQVQEVYLELQEKTEMGPGQIEDGYTVIRKIVKVEEEEDEPNEVVPPPAAVDSPEHVGDELLDKSPAAARLSSVSETIHSTSTGNKVGCSFDTFGHVF